jgi:hypothetical protein
MTTQYIAFRGYNGGKYYGHKMVLCDSADEAEYKIVLKETDTLTQTEAGICLSVTAEKGFIKYWQREEMKSFKGVAFNPDPQYANAGVTIEAEVRKLIKI